jgi:hypothetical protein
MGVLEDCETLAFSVECLLGSLVVISILVVQVSTITAPLSDVLSDG